jgi:hypothetical protein
VFHVKQERKIMDEYDHHLRILNEAFDIVRRGDDGPHLASATLTLLGLGDE